VSGIARRLGRLALTVTLVSAGRVGSGETCPTTPTGVTFEIQQESNWCWAASGQMIMQFLAPGSASAFCQCKQAEMALSASTPGISCCSGCLSNSNVDCDHPSYPDFQAFGFTFQTTCGSQQTDCKDAPLSWDHLKAELCAGRPIAFTHLPKSGGLAHMMVAKDYREEGKKKWVLVLDPQKVCTGANCNGQAWWFSYKTRYKQRKRFDHGFDYYEIK
jgi:hypothetical protein